MIEMTLGSFKHLKEHDAPITVGTKLGEIKDFAKNQFGTG